MSEYIYNWVSRREQLPDGAVINVAREKWVYNQQKEWDTVYCFSQMEIPHLLDYQRECHRVQNKVLGVPEKELLPKEKEFLSWNEILRGYGRILFDFDFDSLEMIQEIYSVFPRGRDTYIPTGLTKAIEDIIIRAILSLSPEHGRILCQKTVQWDTANLAQEKGPFCWSHTCNTKKISFHLTLPLWVNNLPTTREGGIGALEVVYDVVNREANNDPRFFWLKGSPLMDMQLCHRGHQLRLPLCAKRRHVRDPNYIAYFIEPGFSWFHAVSSIYEALIPKEMKMSISSSYVHPLKRELQERETIAPVDASNIDLTEDEVLSLLSDAHINLSTLGYTGVERCTRRYENWCGWRLQKGESWQDCPCCKRRHDKTSSTPVLCASKSHLYLFCFQKTTVSGASGTILLRELEKQDPEKRKMELQMKRLKHTLNEYTPVSQDDVYDLQKLVIKTVNTVDLHIDQYYNLPIHEGDDAPITTAPILMIRSAVGTGKSKLARRLIAEKGDQTSVLIVSTRIAHAQEIGRDLPDFVIYNDPVYKSTWKNSPRLIVELESLHKIALDRYDLLILDECSTILKLFTSSTMKNKENTTWEKLSRYIRFSRQTLFMDAFLIKSDVRIINWICRERTPQVLVLNEFKPNDRQPRLVCRYQDQGSLNTKLFLDRERRKFIVTNSAKWAIKMAKILEESGQNTLLQIGQDKREKSILYGCKEERVLKPDSSIWSEYQNVIITPTVLNGISFEKEHFDTLYIYACKGSCDPLDLLQMSYRVRRFHDKDIHYHMNNQKIPEGYQPLYLYEFVRAMDEGIGVWKGINERNVPSSISSWSISSDDLKYVLSHSETRKNSGQLFYGDIVEFLFTEVMGYETMNGLNLSESKLPKLKSFYKDLCSKEKPLTKVEEVVKEDIDIFHGYVDKESPHAQTLYDEYWAKGGVQKERMKDVCMMRKIIYHEDERDRLNAILPPDGSAWTNIDINKDTESYWYHENWLRKYSTPDLSAKVNCWREFVKWGTSDCQDNGTLSFTSKMLKSKEFPILMRQIETTWNYFGMAGRMVWKHIGIWLKEYMLIPGLDYFDSQVGRNKDTYKIHSYILHTHCWIYNHTYIRGEISTTTSQHTPIRSIEILLPTPISVASIPIKERRKLV